MLTQYVSESSQSSTYGGRGSSRALDGDISTHHHTLGDPGERSFWRAVFVRRMSVSRVFFINRPDCCIDRGDRLDIILIVNFGGNQNSDVCGNTGVYPRGPNPRVLNLPCKGLADELMVKATQPATMSFAEIEIYGTPCN